MATAGKFVIHSTGKAGVLSSGKSAVYNTSGECPECCFFCIDCGMDYQPDALIDSTSVPYSTFTESGCSYNWVGSGYDLIAYYGLTEAGVWSVDLLYSGVTYRGIFPSEEYTGSIECISEVLTGTIELLEDGVGPGSITVVLG